MGQQPVRVGVIMAGGSGERFWPLSRAQRPKQLLRLLDPARTLLEQAADRVAPLIPASHLFVATSTELAAPIRDATPGIPADNVLAEPCRRNTAGCLAWVAAELLARDPAAIDWSMAVLTADHFIPDEEEFRQTLSVALAHVEQHPELGVVGIRPIRPETGYGYIEVERPVTDALFSAGAGTVLPVSSFREKPDAATAASFLHEGRFLWNSGMFFWRISTLLAELAAADLPHAAAIPAMADALRRGDHPRAHALFADLPSISIDFALMEKTRHAAVVPAAFRWDDIGAWDSLDRLRPRTREGNIVAGDSVLVDVRNCAVINDTPAGEMIVAAIGVQDLAIVVTKDAILILPKDRAQDVRSIVQELKKTDGRKL